MQEELKKERYCFFNSLRISTIEFPEYRSKEDYEEFGKILKFTDTEEDAVRVTYEHVQDAARALMYFYENWYYVGFNLQEPCRFPNCKKGIKCSFIHKDIIEPYQNRLIHADINDDIEPNDDSDPIFFSNGGTKKECFDWVDRNYTRFYQKAAKLKEALTFKEKKVVKANKRRPIKKDAMSESILNGDWGPYCEVNKLEDTMERTDTVTNEHSRSLQAKCNQNIADDILVDNISKKISSSSKINTRPNAENKSKKKVYQLEKKITRQDWEEEVNFGENSQIPTIQTEKNDYPKKIENSHNDKNEYKMEEFKGDSASEETRTEEEKASREGIYDEFDYGYNSEDIEDGCNPEDIRLKWDQNSASQDIKNNYRKYKEEYINKKYKKVVEWQIPSDDWERALLSGGKKAERLVENAIYSLTQSKNAQLEKDCQAISRTPRISDVSVQDITDILLRKFDVIRPRSITMAIALEALYFNVQLQIAISKNYLKFDTMFQIFHNCCAKITIHNVYKKIDNQRRLYIQKRTPYQMFRNMCNMLLFCPNPTMAMAIVKVLYYNIQLQTKMCSKYYSKFAVMFYIFHICASMLEFFAISQQTLEIIKKGEFDKKKMLECKLICDYVTNNKKENKIVEGKMTKSQKKRQKKAPTKAQKKEKKGKSEKVFGIKLKPTDTVENVSKKLAIEKITKEDEKKICTQQLIWVKISNCDKKFFAEIKNILPIYDESKKEKLIDHYIIEIDIPLLTEYQFTKFYDKSGRNSDILATIYSFQTLNTQKKEFEALENFCFPYDQNSAKESKTVELDPIRELILQPYRNQEISGKGNEEIHKMVEINMNLKLTPNPAQLETAKVAASRRLSLIQGPPGTGKTLVAALIAKIWLCLPTTRIDSRTKIMATSYSNSAVEELHLKMKDMGIETQIIRKPKDYQELSKYKLDERKKYEEYKKLVAADLTKADVVCVTCVKSMTGLLREFSFPLVILDESTNCTELGSICALVKGCQQLVLIGDDKQLPPLVQSTEGAWWQMGISLYERIKLTLGIQPLFLDIQYRMHKSILKFPSKTFYNSKLKGVKDHVNSQTLQQFPWPKPGFFVCFIDVSEGHEERNPGESSTFNIEEIALITSAIQNILKYKEDSYAKQIGIIAGYKTQSSNIRKALTKYDDKFRFRDNTKEENKEFKKRELYSKIDTNTIDGYQGKEKKLIILSTTRSNLKGEIGFLKDKRRLNVSLTRAHDGLIIFGNKKTLQANNFIWKEYISWLEKKELIMKAPKEWYNEDMYRFVKNEIRDWNLEEGAQLS